MFFIYNVAMSELYPIFLRLACQPVLIVGGGTVGLRKATGLLAAEAEVTVLSMEFHSGFEQLPTIHRITSAYAGDFLGQHENPRWRLVFAATNSAAVNKAVSDDAGRHGLICCRCDDPGAGDFIGPAVQRCGPVTLAVTSGGAAPGLSGELGRQLAAALDPVLVKHIELSGRWRGIVMRKVPAGDRRRRLLQRLSEEQIRAVIRRAGESGAEELFENWLSESLIETSPLPDATMDIRK